MCMGNARRIARRIVAADDAPICQKCGEHKVPPEAISPDATKYKCRNCDYWPARWEKNLTDLAKDEPIPRDAP